MRGLTFGFILATGLGLLHGVNGHGRCHVENRDFDFIIVGGGTAGLAVATQLSRALPYECVLVIEAGPDGRDEPKIYVPGLRGSTLGGVYDWVLPTVPQAAANGRTIPHNRGKVLGGTSALNLLVWNRATVKEFDAWEELGNPGWGWKNMYPAMLKAENFQRQDGIAQYGNDGVGYGGPVQVSLVENPPAHVQACIPTLGNLGLENNLESLNGHSIGAEYQPAMHRVSNHTRSYSVDYLPRAGDNLVIMFNSTVHKVNLDYDWRGTKATGVTLVGGKEIKAKKEVILSGGSLLSPKILELSGIGQKAVLSKAGIRQIVDLPGVGENLQDHLRIQTSYELKPEIPGLDVLKYNTTRAAIELDLWRRSQTSLYQYSGSCYGFLKWKQAIGNDEKLLRLAHQSVDWSNPVDRKKLSLLTDAYSGAPDLEVVFGDGYIGTKGYPAKGTPGHGKNYATLLGGVQHPFSRGSVHINGPDPATKPIIDPKYLGTAFDLEATIQAAKYLRKMATTAPFKDLWVSEFDPGLSVETDAEWETYVRNNVFTFFHPLGTCAMLPKKNGGVVDPELRVYGVQSLRVVDASVIPMIVSAHIQTAIYGIAERAATIITDQYRW
ncbi:GMC oxidoreductase [Cucurbitaria berberidis CBS 394.84]|uniref:GMC oxidoreductase n=1 Tax=Cucurbitaria berberidis CBS 394.84 TaxID=1168544 RepID=A0A9P4G9B2_9PLEO|nr:GMC oxidoreductase [Cucurbitaria berberidis CBS 394.84]KAF1841241.1 GMC oxidoreductase [Cucurbitaria berberidis CBS 394.84]